jgi:hypothetical protein
MTNAEMSGFAEQPRHPLDSTQMFAGPNDGLSETSNGVSTYIGLQGYSQKAGYRVIFPTLDMGRYIEIAEEDILGTEDLSPADSPFGALGGTRVSVRETARIMTSRTASSIEDVDDEFDLDIRLGASGWSAPSPTPGEAMYAPGNEGEERRAAIKTNGACPPTLDTCKTCVTCGAKTCETCATCVGENTCHTCQTACEQHTCQTCKTCAGEATCQTCKGEATCHTCAGEATCETCKGDATCQTCETRCGGHTCVTCITCPPDCEPKTQTCCKPGTCY